MYRLIFIIIAVLAVFGGLVVGTLNADPVNLDLLWVQINWPLGLVLVAALVIGVLLGITLTWIFQVWPARLALKRARAAVQVRETEPDGA
jgi:putative membrane protein